MGLIFKPSRKGICCAFVLSLLYVFIAIIVGINTPNKEERERFWLNSLVFAPILLAISLLVGALIEFKGILV